MPFDQVIPRRRGGDDAASVVQIVFNRHAENGELVAEATARDVLKKIRQMFVDGLKLNLCRIEDEYVDAVSNGEGVTHGFLYHGDISQQAVESIREDVQSVATILFMRCLPVAPFAKVVSVQVGPKVSL